MSRALVVAIALAASCRDHAPFVHYEPTPPEVVDVMLRLADIKPNDVVYDLGCGDGRLVIAAVQRGARGVCVDIDALRIAEAKKNAIAAGVADRIRFATEDLFTTDLHDATVVMLYLSQAVNVKLRPRLQQQLARGARIVSHWHDMGDWPPTKTARVRADDWVRPIYLWIIGS